MRDGHVNISPHSHRLNWFTAFTCFATERLLSNLEIYFKILNARCVKVTLLF